ncbi:MAG TPA: PqqD family protein [Gemmatimonadaceae bacterium]|nr:PqqD family protein [Gemmatimonadaceae bacterium]
MTSYSGGRWARATGIIARRVAGETVLVPVASRAAEPEYKSARLYVLNETGEYLWSLLDRPRTASDLARNLTLAFETTAGRAHSDVDVFLAALRDIGAVHEVTGAGSE